MSDSKSNDFYVCMHEVTSAGFDFKTAMEGYARAGVRAVEPDLLKVREFAEKESPAVARRLLDDLGLNVVSCSNQILLEESGPEREQSLEDLKWKVELAETIGGDRLVIPSLAANAHVAADYEQVRSNLREAADIASPHGVALMLEFTYNSKLVACFRTALELVREINHPHLKVMLDTFHLWAGRSKLEDLELLEHGELHHVHIEDMPATPHVEVFQQKDRVYPGEGIVPYAKVLDTLKCKGYSGALSLELFDPVVQATDPYEVALKARETIERFL